MSTVAPVAAMLILAAFTLLWFVSLLAWMVVWRRAVNPRRVEERLRHVALTDPWRFDELSGSAGAARAHQSGTASTS
ncbi:MAG: hypothetical protein JNM79_23525 [Burkholderiales bacterium]|nr:hypothetical protein [Burkholderiales bacterium]